MNRLTLPDPIRVTIYRDSSGLPAWATITGCDEEPEFAKQLGEALKTSATVFSFDSNVVVEVI